MKMRHMDQVQSVYTPGEFNSLISDKGLTDKISKIFSCIHFNCRSNRKNCDNLTSMLGTLDLEFSIIGLTQTSLQEYYPFYNLPNYTCDALTGREGKKGGGIGLLY